VGKKGKGETAFLPDLLEEGVSVTKNPFSASTPHSNWEEKDQGAVWTIVHVFFCLLLWLSSMRGGRCLLDDALENLREGGRNSSDCSDL
jgi:hypothetical protein